MLKKINLSTLTIGLVTLTFSINNPLATEKVSAASFGSISQIYAYGDSYSEEGLSLDISTAAVNAGVTDSFILPADPNLGLYDPQGRWTNGATAVENLSSELQVDLTNYAVGGGKSGNGNYYSWLDSFQDTGVFGQIEQFSNELGGNTACQPVFPIEPRCANPDQYYFWDEYHPTRRVHEIIGEDLAQFAIANQTKSVPESSLVVSLLMFSFFAIFSQRNVFKS